MKRTYVLAVVIGFLSQGTSAQLADAGLVAFPMLNLNYDAREMGMAGASIAMPNGLYGFRSNPAAMGYVEARQGLVGYRSVLLDVWSGVAAFGMPVGETGFWSLSAINLSEGSEPEVLNLNGEPYQTDRVFAANSVSGCITWSRIVWKTLALGAALKGVYHYIGTQGEYYSSDGFAFDVGVQYRTYGGRLVVGVVARNLGFMRSSYTEDLPKYQLPYTLGIGISYIPKYVSPLRMALDIEKVNGRYVSFEPAVEIAILRDLLFARLGFPFSERDLSHALSVLGGNVEENYVKSQWNSLCFGLGFHTDLNNGLRVMLDAAVELHTVQQASVGVSGIFEF
jgi:hypothetical protein